MFDLAFWFMDLGFDDASSQQAPSAVGAGVAGREILY
jgi:hypothetical protein